jgi:hypothetical protein
MDFIPGDTVKWYDSGWRYGTYVRTIHPRRGKSGIKGEVKVQVNRGGSTEKVPARMVQRHVRRYYPNPVPGGAPVEA